MIRQEPPADWVAYLIVILVTMAMVLGKYLIAKGDKPIDEVIKDDMIHDLEEEFEELTHAKKDKH